MSVTTDQADLVAELYWGAQVEYDQPKMVRALEGAGFVSEEDHYAAAVGLQHRAQGLQREESYQLDVALIYQAAQVESTLALVAALDRQTTSAAKIGRALVTTISQQVARWVR